MANEHEIKGQFLSDSRSARQVISPLQGVALIILIAAVASGWFYRPVTAFTIFNFFAIFFYLAFMIYKMALITSPGHRRSLIEVTEEEIMVLDDSRLPVYTILIPLYKEAEVARQIVNAVKSLDYPLEKLDVKFLLEADDDITREAFGKLSLPPSFEMVTVPDGRPRTKPRACNVGLSLARGEYIVIYDAEDIPEPDQLKKSIVGFSKVPENVICLQGKLNFYNQHQNLLTRWFTLEYSMWFDLYLPALGSLDAPIPLGGTSNHFRTGPLKELGGWDAYNVTEDCDLGIRLYRNGYRTIMLNSTTWEEACGNLKYWLAQRSRWVKGYIQTYLVHLKNPFALLFQIGLKKFLHFNLLIGGLFFSLLINPFYWFLLLVWIFTRWQVMEVFFPPVIFFMGAVCLFVGNFVFVYKNAAGACYREYYGLVKYAFLTPFYWILMSLGAWKGFIQLIARPFYWEKTKHGFAPPESGNNEN